MTEEEIKDRMKKVCLCRAISKGTIIDAVKEGAHSVDAVKKKTGATTGACNGGRCTLAIKEIIEAYK